MFCLEHRTYLKFRTVEGFHVDGTGVRGLTWLGLGQRGSYHGETNVPQVRGLGLGVWVQGVGVGFED